LLVERSAQQVLDQVDPSGDARGPLGMVLAEGFDGAAKECGQGAREDVPVVRRPVERLVAVEKRL